ncbi:hypothetical protein KY290_018382 [Solanum tuberosum]|uniref:Uncharacterized protein n=1 Tax=Solanum tuberosum TaxID=4113 RepID=A0ABQ7VFE6_SOLTU|nr:hypothetical protein KY290_018382 [Solanum tuberosum]
MTLGGGAGWKASKGSRPVAVASMRAAQLLARKEAIGQPFSLRSSSSSSSPLILFSNSNLLRPQAFAYKVLSQIGDSFAFRSSSKSARGRGSLWLARAQCRCSKETYENEIKDELLKLSIRTNVPSPFTASFLLNAARLITSTPNLSALGINFSIFLLIPSAANGKTTKTEARDNLCLVHEKYIIPEAAKKWTLVTIREAWRRHRSGLKINYYDPYDNDEVQMAKKPSHIPECQFRELLKYWKSEKFKVEMEAIETQMDTNDQSVDAFSAVMGPEHPGRLRLYGVGVTKTILKRKAGNSDHFLNATDDVVIIDVIAQLQNAGLIDHNILAALFVPPPREASTSAQAADQGDEIEGDERSTKDLT